MLTLSHPAVIKTKPIFFRLHATTFSKTLLIDQDTRADQLQKSVLYKHVDKPAIEINFKSFVLGLQEVLWMKTIQN